ncbi:hypothetical protein ABPG75_000884 [Micractinium tetrahymenae]
MRATFGARSTPLTLLIAHAPTSQHPEQQEAFAEEFEAAAAAVPGRHLLVAMGDWNARPGSRSRQGVDIYTSCLGPHGCGKRNPAGERLLQTCAALGLCVAGTFFRHRQRATWHSADGVTAAALDHFLVLRRRLSPVLDSRVYRHRNLLAPAGWPTGFSDHHLIVADILLKLRKQEEAVVAHIEQLLNGGGTVSEAVLAGVACEPSHTEFPPPAAEEVQQALEQLRYGKAADALGVTAELLRAGGPAFQAALHALVCRAHLLEQQCGFRPGRGCADQIFVVRRLEEMAREWGRQLHCCAVDLTAAFDSVPREALWALAAAALPAEAVRLLQRMYDGTACQLRLEGRRRSRSFAVRCGVQQGCPASSNLFNLFINKVVEEALAAAGTCGITVCYRLDGQLRQMQPRPGEHLSEQQQRQPASQPTDKGPQR